MGLKMNKLYKSFKSYNIVTVRLHVTRLKKLLRLQVGYIFLRHKSVILSKLREVSNLNVTSCNPALVTFKSVYYKRVEYANNQM